MAYQEHLIVYRQQMETADENVVVSREIMQACYLIVMVDDVTGDLIPTNKKGIINIPLNKYPDLQAAVESFVPMFIAAFQQEYQELKAIIELAKQSQDNPLVSPVP